MKTKAIFLSLAAGLALFSACEELPDLIYGAEEPLAITDTQNFPAKVVPVDTTITLKALFQPKNGCGQRSRIDTATVGKVFTMTFYVKYPEEGSDVLCTDVARPLYHTITFRPKEVGTYEFKFWQEGNTYLTKTITVRAK